MSVERFPFIFCPLTSNSEGTFLPLCLSKGPLLVFIAHHYHASTRISGELSTFRLINQGIITLIFPNTNFEKIHICQSAFLQRHLLV